MDISKWLQEGIVNLTVKRVQMLGPPGSGKTCSQRLLLNQDPPEEAVTDSTPIACRAVKATRISVDGGHMERVDAKALLSRLACDLKESTAKQKETPTEDCGIKSKKESSETTPLGSSETKATDATEKADPIESAGPAHDPDSQKIRRDIVEAIPTAKANLNSNLVYIVDSGGQTAFQELLPLFTRAASLNIITLDLSKGMDEKLDLPYRIKKKQFSDPNFSATNFEFLKDLLSSGAVSQPYKDKYPGYFVLGTHSDNDDAAPNIEKYNRELSSLTSGSKAEKGYRIIPAKLGEIIYPVNTMLKSGLERQEESKKLCNIILKDKSSNDTFPMPVRWFAFELTLLEKAGSNSCLEKPDVLSIGKSLEMSEDDTEQALQYLHKYTIILYYPQVLPDIVFVDPHPILDTLSRLLALTYNIPINDLSLITKEGADIIDSDDLSKLRTRGIFTKSLLDMLYCDQGFFKSDHFIKLLLDLHIIVKTQDGYFIPSALPSSGSPSPPPESNINSLLIVWRNPITTNIVPVPRGIFPLTVANLMTFRQPEFCFPPTSMHKKFFTCRDAMSFCVSVHKERIGIIHLIKKTRCIEISFKGEALNLKYCPLICEAVAEAINSSSEAINLEPDGHEFAFACCSKDCYRIVTNEAEEKVEYLCDESAIISGQEKYWSWFHVTHQNSTGGNQFNL